MQVGIVGPDCGFQAIYGQALKLALSLRCYSYKLIIALKL